MNTNTGAVLLIQRCFHRFLKISNVIVCEIVLVTIILKNLFVITLRQNVCSSNVLGFEHYFCIFSVDKGQNITAWQARLSVVLKTLSMVNTMLNGLAKPNMFPIRIACFRSCEHMILAHCRRLHVVSTDDQGYDQHTTQQNL